jgi:hypothetical protein
MSLDNCDKYMVGNYDLKSDTFVPDTVLDDRRLWSRIDYGNYYASKSFFDSKKAGESYGVGLMRRTVRQMMLPKVGLESM